MIMQIHPIQQTPQGQDREIRADEAARMLGVGRGIVYRLYHAGFIRGRMPSVRCLLLSTASIQAHMEATKDPEFWERNAKPW